MDISICAATQLELAPIQQRLLEEEISIHRLQFFTTGVGMLQSTFHIQQHILEAKPSCIIQLGIAGCFDKHLSLGSTVIVEKEYLGSLGVIEKSPHNEGWKDVFDLGLELPNKYPFSNRALLNTWLQDWSWLKDLGRPFVSSVTVDEITSTAQRAQLLQRHYQPVTESMEGGSLHYASLKYHVPFIQIRGISNYVGERNKAHWKIGLALQGATNTTVAFLNHLKL